MRGLHSLAWRNLRAHPLRSILTTLATVLGVAMVLAAAVVGQAASRSATQLAETSQMANVVLVQAVLAMVGIIILLAAGFVILNAFAMNITGRTQELAVLRALGLTRRQALRLVLLEAGLLGLTGSGLGLAAGLGLAQAVMQTMGSLEDVPFVVPWWGLALSLSLGPGVTLGAALQPALRASRISPIAASRPAAAPPGWYERSGGRLGGALLGCTLTATAAYALLARPDVLSAIMALVVGQAGMLGATVLLLPGLVGPIAALGQPILRQWLGIPGRLAVDNLRRNKLRAALTAGGLAAGLIMLVAMNGLIAASLKGSVLRLGTMLHEDGFVVADIAALVDTEDLAVENFLQAIAIPLQDMHPILEVLRPLEEAGQIRVERCSFAAVPPELATIPGSPGIFVDPEIFLSIGNFDFFQGDARTAADWMQQGRAVLLPPLAADRLGVQAGDKILLPTRQGQISFTVAGIGGSAYAMPVLSYIDGQRHFGLVTPTHLGIIVLEEDAAAVLSQVEGLVLPFGLTLNRYENTYEPMVGMADRLQQMLNALLLLAVVVAALGVVNTVVINVTERQRELVTLRAIGATQSQVRRAVVAEAALLGLLAALVAAVLGLLMLAAWGLLILPNGTASLGVRADGETFRLTMGAGLREWALAALGGLVFGPLVAGTAAYLPARQAASRAMYAIRDTQ